LLAALVALYIAASIGVGLYAASRVRTSADYAVAGRHLPLPIVMATVFATWFGAETVLGIPSTYLKEGLSGVVADPFASSACLVLVGLFFARRLYRLNLLTIGDYYRTRYNRATEVVLSICIALSYLGWVAAQFIAIGLAFNVISGGAIDARTGMIAGAAIVLVYTMAGGMWSVALTDFLQAAVIIAGMIYVAWVVAGLAGGAGRVIEAASQSGRLRFLPEAEPRAVMAFLSSGLAMMLGSIPQQDLFQRVMSAKDESTAARASIAGGILYFCIALVPMFLVTAATLIDPAMVERVSAGDHQLILPTLILERTPLAVQVLFFGALLSAILSTASGAMLAPAVSLAENVIKPMLPPLSDRALLWTMRFTVAVLAVVVLVMALNSKLGIYELVDQSSKVVIVSAFVPLVAGLYWPRANGAGAAASIVAGLGTWIAFETLDAEGAVAPALAGFIAAIVGMAAGSLLVRGTPNRPS
jgi:solute:Na+ symporter, SSS family